MLAASPAAAQDRDYCPARPGLGDTPCTIAPGRVSVEIGAAAWERDGGIDTVTLAETFVRVGLTDSAEADIGWTPYVHQPGMSGPGDVTLALRQNLHHPDGNGFSIALEPFATLPVGSAPGGAGDWSAGLVVPASFDLGHGLSLQSTTQIAAAVDADRHGRHFAVGEVVGLEIDLTGKLGLTLEMEADRDEDPAVTTTQDYAGASLAWGVSDDLQLDIGAVAGLNASAADEQIYAGISRRF
jgi:hypothetical protein